MKRLILPTAAAILFWHGLPGGRGQDLRKSFACVLQAENFLETADGIGIENLFTGGDKAQPDGHSGRVLEFLGKTKSARLLTVN